MILLIDAGNSRIKWASLVGGVLQAGEPIAHGGEAGDVHALSLAWAPLPRPVRILAVNVLGAVFADALAGWAEDTWGLDVEFVVSQREACGVVNAYREPERLGADRWVALIAARHACSGPVCVVDCGTALTIDVLAPDGEHLGGLIIPGLAMMRRSLVERTTGIRSGSVSEYGAEQEADAPLFARDTVGGVISGTRYALAAAIDRITGDVRAAMAGEVRCLLTGGDAGIVLPLLTGQYDYVPELVLDGLAVMAGESA
jgi:type III pantothenate kinase